MQGNHPYEFIRFLFGYTDASAYLCSNSKRNDYEACDYCVVSTSAALLL